MPSVDQITHTHFIDAVIDPETNEPIAPSASFTDDQIAAIEGSASPSSGNVFATMDDLPTSETRAIEFIIDGGGSAITAGVKGDIEIPFACTITAWRVFADQTGSITVGIWKDTYANFPPVVGDLLVSPALSSAAKAEATGLSHAVTAGDILRFNANATPSTVTRVTVSLTVTVSL